MTKEERFMLKLFDLSSGHIGEIMDREKIARLVGISVNAVKNTVNLLAQANFIRKYGDKEIAMTSQGKELVERLRSG